VGSPIQVLAFRGGQQEPQAGHTFGPAPAGMMAIYRDSDLLPGMDEDDLTLYRRDGTVWVVATCAGYAIERFPEENLIAVPICEAGTFALSDEAPVETRLIFLPVVFKNAR
jgi:hypothetical protein